MKSLLQPGIQGVPQSLTHEVYPQYRKKNRHTGKSGKPPILSYIAPAVGNDHSPRRNVKGNANPDKAQGSLHKNNPGHPQGSDNNNRRKNIGQNFFEHNMKITRPYCAGRFNILAFPGRQHFTSYHPAGSNPFFVKKNQKKIDNPPSQHSHKTDGKDQIGKGQKDIHHSLNNTVYGSSIVTGDKTH